MSSNIGFQQLTASQGGISDEFQQLTRGDGGINDGLHGATYQIKLMMLFAYQAKQNNCEFLISTEVKEACKFDDLIYQYKDSGSEMGIKFGQAKWSRTQKSLTLDDFKSSKNYKLSKYFESFMSIKRNPKFKNYKDFMIITNNELKTEFRTQSNLFVLKNQNNSEQIYLEEKTPSDVIFGSHAKQLKIVSNTCYSNEHQKTLKTISKFISCDDDFEEDDVAEFLESLTFVTELNESDIDGILKSEISADLNLKNITHIYKDFEMQFINNVKKDCNITLQMLKNSFDTWKDFLKTRELIGLTQNYIENLNKIQFEFKDHSKYMEEFLLDSNSCYENRIQVILTPTGETKFPGIKILKTLKSIAEYSFNDSFLMTNTHLISLESLKQFLNRFKNDYCIKLLVLECDYVKKYYLIEEDLLDIVKNTSKKLIIVAPECVDLNENLTNIVKENPLYANQLTENSILNLLEKEITFQDHKICLKDLIDPKNQNLLAKLLVRDLRDMKEIGGSKKLSYNKELFIDRKLLMDEKMYEVDEVMKLNEKSIVISDEAGNGKSVLLNFIACKYKLLCPKKWIIKIDFNEYSKEFKKGIVKMAVEANDQNFHINFLIEDLLKIDKETEKLIFKELLWKPNSTVLLFDAFDETLYHQFALDLMTQLKSLPIEKIFITTRPEFEDNLSTFHNEKCFSIIGFSQADQTLFISKFFTQKTASPMQTMPNKVTDILQSFHTIASLPLITTMIAEILDESETNVSISMCEIYEKFSEKRYAIFIEKSKLETSNVISKNFEADLKESLNKTYESIAFHQVFNPEELKLLRGLKIAEELSQRDLNNASKCGLVRKTNNELKFIHKTFAEFRVMISLNKNLSNANIFEFLVTVAFAKNECKVVRSLFNGKLDSIIEHFGRFLISLYDKCNEKVVNIFKVAIKERMENNLKFFFGSIFHPISVKSFESSKIMCLQKDILTEVFVESSDITSFLDYLKNDFGKYFVKKLFQNCVRKLLFIKISEKNFSRNVHENLRNFFGWVKLNFNDEFYVEQILFNEKVDGWNKILFFFASSGQWDAFWLYFDELQSDKCANFKKDFATMLSYERNATVTSSVTSKLVFLREGCLFYMKDNYDYLFKFLITAGSVLDKKSFHDQVIACHTSEALLNFTDNVNILKLLETIFNFFGPDLAIKVISAKLKLSESFLLHKIQPAEDSENIHLRILDFMKTKLKLTGEVLHNILTLKNFTNETFLGDILVNRKITDLTYVTKIILWIYENVGEDCAETMINSKSNTGNMLEEMAVNQLEFKNVEAFIYTVHDFFKNSSETREDTFKEWARKIKNSNILGTVASNTESSGSKFILTGVEKLLEKFGES